MGFVTRVRYLLLLPLLAALAPAAVFGAGFPIAAAPAQGEDTHGVASDGTNFLVAYQRSNNPLPGATEAKLVSPAGVVLATVSVPRTGDPPLVAFDGTNYLLVWADYSNNPFVSVYGQLVSTAGAAVGAPFQISQSTSVNELNAVAFDGTRYLVVWTNNRPFVSQHDIYGRFVSTAGIPAGLDFDIDDGAGRTASVAFGAGSYLVVWNEDVANTETRARFVTPAGLLQPPFTVNGSPFPSDNPGAAAFDGTNFLVVWSDEGIPGAPDFFAQLVSPAAVLVGAVIPLVIAPGPQIYPFIAFDGVNYLVTWTDLANDANGDFQCDPGEGTCMDVRGQQVSPAGTLVGTSFGVATDAGNQGVSPVAYGASKYLVAWSDLSLDPNGDVYGAFLFDTSASLDFFSLAPCRVIDTRGGAPIGGPVLQAQQTRTFAVSGNCAIPATAKALSINLAVTQSTAGGNLRLFPGGQSVPTISTINYGVGQTRGNNAIIALSANGEMAAFVGQPAGTTVHLIVDVNGYFE